MRKFEAGDEVRGNGTGTLYKVISEDSCTDTILVEVIRDSPYGKIGARKNLDSCDVTLEEPCKVKVSSSTDYTFTTRDASMVCTEEIDISRELPIAVIQAKGFNALYVHGSLCNKAEALGFSLPKGRQWPDDTYTILCKDYKQLAKRLGKLKFILKAPWPKGTGTIQVRVKLLGSN